MNPINLILRILGGLSDRYLGSNFLSNQAAEQDYQRTRELRQNDYDQQWKMFNAQNDYNSPSNQLARFRDAGLNPNLMYGAPPALAANVTPNASGSFSSPRGANGAGDLISSIQQASFMKKQKELLQAEIDNKKTDTTLKGTQVDWTRGQIDVGKSVVLYNNAMTDYTSAQKKEVVANCELLAKKCEEISQNMEESRQRVSLMSAQEKSEYIKQNLDSAKIQEIANNMHWTTEQGKAYVALTLAQVNGIDADVALKAAQVNLTNAETHQVYQATENLKVANDQLSFEYQQNLKYDSQRRQMELDKMASDIILNSFNTQSDISKKLGGNGDLSRKANGLGNKVAPRTF